MNTIFCLVPVLLILVTAVITKRTLFAMFLGLASASIIVSISGKNGIIGIKGVINDFFGFIYESITNETLQWLVLVISLFGILIMLFEKSGAINDFGNFANKIIKTKRQALVGGFILGIIIFVDDYLNNLAVSTTMKGITDKHKIPRTQLGYLANSTAAPVCILLPLSTWAVYFGGLFKENGVGETGMDSYFQAIPLMFYGWIAIIVVFLQILGIMPKIGQLKKDYKRASETGNVFPEGEMPLDSIETNEVKDTETKKSANPLFFLVPLLVMIGVSVFTEIVGDIDILLGVTMGTVSAFLIYLIFGKLKFKKLLNASYDGVISMGFIIILSVLSFAVQAANTKLGLAEFVIESVKPIMNGALLPVIVFIVCGLYAYVTGSFWDMAVIVAPIVIPLALAMDVSPVLAGAALFSGAALGSTTCLYGDGVILASQGAGIKPLNLMIVTLPYAGIAAAISAILYLVFGFIM